MKALLKNDTFLVLVATLAVLTLGVIVLPLVVALGCKALLFIFNKPLMALAISGAFLAGIFVGQLKS
jgi:hypothetical protein